MTSTMKLILVFLVSGLLLVEGAIISPDGRAYRQIVLENGQASSVQLAAKELQHFLKEISGEELPIVSEATEKPFIIIGANKLLKEAGIDTESLQDEGWAFKTTNDFLALYGQDYSGPLLLGPINPWRSIEAYNPELQLNAFGASGTLSAVYEFLHRKAGVRFYLPGPDGTVIPQIPNFQIPELDEKGAPKVPWRWAWMCMLSQNKDTSLWSKRIGIGGKAPIMIIHSYRNFLKYKDTHPEYFALADGKRSFGNECAVGGYGHLCLSNPDVVQQWADDICDYFTKNPSIDVYPLAPNDGLTRICECNECQKDLDPAIDGDEKHSLHIWKFTSKVAAKVAEKFPDKYVGCLAYEHYHTPPRTMGKMKNVAVMFCYNRSEASNPDYKKKYHSEIETWSERVDRIYLWSWYLNHWLPWTNLPVLYMRNIQNELTWLYKNPKFYGEFIESEGQQGGGNDFQSMQTPGMMHLNLYMTGRMYMDPSSNADAILTEYAKLFYGPAEKPMFDFWNAVQNEREKAFAKSVSVSVDKLYTTELLKELQEYLAQAIASVEPDSVWRRRIDIVKNEFDKGASRLIRLESVGIQKIKTPVIQDFNDLDQQEGQRFAGKDGAVFSPATWMTIGRDRQYLCLRFLCFEDNMDKLEEHVKSNDDINSWRDDSIEVFLYPDENDFHNGFQILVTSSGFLFDKHCTDILDGDEAWSSDAKINIVKEENRWIAEIKIPFENLGINDPNFAGNIITNVYRNRVREGQHTSSCWNPTGLGYHNCPKKFGVISLH